MYESFYNLRERPFALSPDPEYLYLSRVHREALDSLRYGIESRAGFIVVTGEIGAGKTTLLQSLMHRLHPRTVVARIVNTTLDPRELLETILLEFNLHTAGKSKPVLLRELAQFLVRMRSEGRRPLLVVDEAQNLGPAALEEIRLLSNLETEKSKLLQIVLVGQPNLRDTLATRGLEQFRQRVAVSYHLAPLDVNDTAAYINYRLSHAANGEPPQFPPDAAALVHQMTGGVPRIINVVCDATLVYGYVEERRNIDRPLIQAAIAELCASGVLLREAQTCGVTLEVAAVPAFDNVPVRHDADMAGAASSDAVIRAGEMGTPEPAPPIETPVGAPGDTGVAGQPSTAERVVSVPATSAAWEETQLLSDRWERDERIAAAVSARGGRYERIEQTLTDSPERLGRVASPIFGAPTTPARPDHFWHRIFRFLGGEPALRS